MIGSYPVPPGLSAGQDNGRDTDQRLVIRMMAIRMGAWQGDSGGDSRPGPQSQSSSDLMEGREERQREIVTWLISATSVNYKF